MKTLAFLFGLGLFAMIASVEKTEQQTVSTQSPLKDTTKAVPTSKQLLRAQIIDSARIVAGKIEDFNTQGLQKMKNEKDFYKKKYLETLSKLKQTENVVVQLMTRDSVTIEPDIANNYYDTTHIPCTTGTVRIYLKKKFLGGYKTVKE